MSVNYYAKTGEEHGEGIHIGQHVRGAEFLFRAHQNLGLTDCIAWRRYLDNSDVQIEAESGYLVSLDELWPDATARPADVGGSYKMRARWPPGSDRSDRWRDDHGHPFAAYEFC